MEIKFFNIGLDSIADFIGSVILFFVGDKLKRVSITQEDILKFYIEAKLYLRKNNVFNMVDEEAFLRFIKMLLDETEVILNEQRKNDPQVVDRVMKKFSGLWKIYAAVNQFFDANDISNLINSNFSKKIQNSFDKKIIQNETLLKYKTKRVVDEAIKDYEDIVEINEPIVEHIKTVTKDVDNPFGFSEIRILGKWVDNS